ncbi:MAG: diguanylate cyclase [Meiothermus sp.]
MTLPRLVHSTVRPVAPAQAKPTRLAARPIRAKLGSNMRVAIILLGSLLGFVAVHLLRLGEYGLPWLMIAVATLASVYGLRWGLLAGAVALGLELWLEPSHSPAWPAVLLLLSVFIANLVGRDLRRIYRRQKEASAQLSLLVAALEELSSLPSRTSILEALPGLLGKYGEGHVSVWQPAPGGLRLVSAVGLETAGIEQLPESGVVGRCAREGRVLHIEDVRRDTSYIAVPGRDILSELALPLWERGQVVAVVNLERTSHFNRRELEGFEHFTKAVSSGLTQLSERRELQFLNQLSTSLDSTSTPLGVAERALALILQALETERAMLWIQQGSRMVALVEFGPEGKLELEESLKTEGIPFGQGLVWQVYATGRPIYATEYTQTPQAVAEYRQQFGGVVVHPIPLPTAGRSRIVLSLAQTAPRLWSEAEQDTLAAACRTIGLALDGVLAMQQRDLLIGLTREAAEAPAQAAYQKILEAAVRLVPGAEAGSLLVRDGATFRFRAAVGFGQELMKLSFSEAEQFRWYAGPLKDWNRGEPRILSAQKDNLADLSSEGLEQLGRMNEIKTNLALPVVYRGEVLALLYLDNLHDESAFAQDSLEVARFFAAPIAALLHEVRYRGLLEQAALTDALTGLANRRAFDLRLGEELERSQRYGHPLSLLVMDLSGFKRINDTLGHAKGDEVLAKVAEVLKRHKRDGDSLYRWGGDEFAAILPHTDLEGATCAAGRYAAAIAEIQGEGFEVKVNIGAAAYPAESGEHDGLLQLADHRMYEAKNQGVAIIAMPG